MTKSVDNRASSTAWVYRGAAILIFIVGLRSIFSTMEAGEEWELLTILTIGALLFELGLLFWYASTIEEAVGIDESGSYNLTLNTEPIESKLGELNNQVYAINLLLEKIHGDGTKKLIEAINENDHSEDIVEAINNINIADRITLESSRLEEELNTVTTELNLLRSDIGTVNRDIVYLNEKINEFVDTGIKERVHKEVNSIIAKMVSSKE